MSTKISKFGPHLKELRIHLCQTGKASKGVRDFIKKYYVEIKNCNPQLPILIRECSGVQPRLWARYEKGKESNISLANLDADGVLCEVECITKNPL